MNQAHSRNQQYWAEDFEPPYPSGAHLFFCAVVLAVFCMAIGFGAGFEFANNLHKQRAEAAKKLTPKPVAQKPPPYLNCSDPIRSREIVSQVCRARLSSAKVGL